MALMSLGSLNISLVRLQKMISHGFPISVCECQWCVYELLKVNLKKKGESQNLDG